MSSILLGEETNVGLLYRVLTDGIDVGEQLVNYDPGVQGEGWRKWLHAASGIGINRSIRRGYGFLARNFRPGDRIYLFGYSRGAYAVRSLAGMIGRVGLLRREFATERYVRLAFRFYEFGASSLTARHFARTRCHESVEIEMLGIWDTVKSLGLPYPLLNRLAPMATEFHDDKLGRHILHGYHALGIDEDRSSFAPLLWQRSEDWEGRLEQTWFAGAHGDVGGDVRDFPPARPLANISLNWMLRRAARHGLVLPGDWEARYPEDPAAPMAGSRRGMTGLFLMREPRAIGTADGEAIHLSMRERMHALPRYTPRGSIGTLPDSAP